MTIKLELSRQLTESALDLKIASLKRSITGSTNPMIKEILQKELREVEQGRNTMVEATK